MSNKQQLQINNDKYTSLIEILRDKATGVELPELTNEGTASDLLFGKQLIDGEGNMVKGTFTIDNEITTQADLVAQIQTALQGKAGGVEQATPEISINSSTGLVTATAGSKSSTYQLAFQPAKTITPSTTSQIAVSSGYYTGGNITVASVLTQSKNVTPKTTSQDVTPDGGKFLSKVTVSAIPSTYIQPTGTLNVTENGTHDVKNYANVNVSVESGSSSGELVDYSEAEEAMVTGNLSTYTNDRVTSVGSFAFYSCRSLTTVNFPNVTSIGTSAFHGCQNLTTISFPNVSSIGSYAFHGCSSLTSVSFPQAATIGSNAFEMCKNLTTADFPKATTLVRDAFGCCYSLASISFPNVSSIGGYAFAYCYSLTSVSFPQATTIGSYAFEKCSQLTTISFPKAIVIGNSAFSKCCNLKSLYLTGSSLCKLSHSNAFASTPIGGYSTSAGTYGSIYVPLSLVAAYRSATNWTYFSSRFAPCESDY